MKKKFMFFTVLTSILLVISTYPRINAGVIGASKPIKQKVKKIDVVGEVIKAFPLPKVNPQMITWDGNTLWVTDDETDKLYQLDPAKGKVIFELAIPGLLGLAEMDICGLTWDGSDLLISDYTTGTIYRVDPQEHSAKVEVKLWELKRGRGVRSIAMKESRVTGLAWDGTYLWAAFAAGYASSVYRIDLASKTLVTHFWAPGPKPQGLAWDGNCLWIVDGRSQGKIYKFDPKGKWTGTLVHSPAGSPTGLAFDGKNLWNVDKEKRMIYKIEVLKEEAKRKHIKGEH
jgi:sugar lactone lactonase YvrE